MKYLETNHLVAVPDLVRRLPAELAFEYHVLPLVEENEYVTVAMANPEDMSVREEISAHFDRPVYVVRSDSRKIDARLFEVWCQGATERVALLDCSASRMVDKKSNEYEHYLNDFCGLVNGFITHSKINYRSTYIQTKLLNSIRTGGYDLVAVNQLGFTPLKRLCTSWCMSGFLLQIPSSLLVVQENYWPLRQILLVLRFDQTDRTAFEWARRLSELTNAVITILPITPFFPVIYDYAINEILEPESRSGKQFHGYIQQLEDQKIHYKVHHHNCLPELQIRTELESRPYDLVIMGAESKKRLTRWLSNSLVVPLLKYMNTSVLISNGH